MVGNFSGRKEILDPDEQKFVMDVIRRKDCGNSGMIKNETIDKVHEMLPNLMRKRGKQSFKKTVWYKILDLMNPKRVKSQATTTKMFTITDLFQLQMRISFSFLRANHLRTSLSIMRTLIFKLSCT